MPRLPVDYSKASIYKLVCNDITVKEIYVGSTTDFTNRKCNHKSSCTNSSNKNHHYRVYKFIRDNG